MSSKIDYLVSVIDGNIHVSQWDSESQSYEGDGVVMEISNGEAMIRDASSGSEWTESITALEVGFSSFDTEWDEAVATVSI